VAAMTYTPIPYVYEMLLVAALVIFSGIALLNFSQRGSR